MDNECKKLYFLDTISSGMKYMWHWNASQKSFSKIFFVVF